MIYINNTHPTHINYQDAEIKKLYLGNKIIYYSIRDKEIDTWEECLIEQQGWTVDLNNQWVLSTVRQDANTNYQTYMSNSNKGVHSSISKMKVNIAQGISTFTLHYGSYAEGNYDYTLVGHLDMDMSNATSALTATSTTVSTSYWKASSRGSQSSSAPNLTATYTIADTSKEHFIWIAYRKDGSTHTSDDRGYVSFDKTLNTTVDGWRKIDYTYIPQQITPYVYKFFVGEQYVYSEDKETIIKRDPITATTTEIQPTFNEVEDTFTYERHIYKKKYYVVNGEQTEYYTFGEDMGEVSVTLPPNYMFNYNFKNYNSSTKTVPNESEALWQQNLVLQGTPNVSNGRITVTESNAYMQYPFASTSANPFNIPSTGGYMTVIFKYYPESTSVGDLIGNRGYYATGGNASSYNWMVRLNSSGALFHGMAAVGSITTTKSVPTVVAITVNGTNITYKNLTNNTTSTTAATFNYQSGRICFFVDNHTSSSTTTVGEKFTGTVYWMFCAKRVLTDQEINDVIEYNNT